MPGEGFNCPWPPLIKMDAAVKAKVEVLSQVLQPPLVRQKEAAIATDRFYVENLRLVPWRSLPPALANG